MAINISNTRFLSYIWDNFNLSLIILRMQRLLIYISLLFFAVCFCEELITLKRAKELRKIAKWKVADPNKNPLKRFTFEVFKRMLKGARPLAREIMRTVKDALKGMNIDEIKALLNSPFPKAIIRSAEKSAKEMLSKPKTNPEATSNDGNSGGGKRRLPSYEDEDVEDLYRGETQWWRDEGDDGSRYVPASSNRRSRDENNNDENENGDDGLPKKFDGRKRWGKCIHSGRDQGECNGCWAFGIANHMSDRFCIAGKDVMLSPQDLLECCSGNSCCQGGTAGNGYKYMMEIGLVDENCKPFNQDCGECRPSSCPRYRCEEDSMFWAETIEDAKREIYKNGPIEGVFDIYDDFPYYAGGVYYKTSDKFLGIHTVEILGWGKSNGENYWLCKNCWGDNWGDSSFFMIRMGECGINEALTTCQPLV